ncbi:MAG: hypothetical protein ACKOKE_06440 [Actinomycetota bacterium]
MRAELFRPDAPDAVIAVIAWNGGRPVVESGAEVPGVADLLRPIAVRTDDPALRRLGTSGESVLTPGSLPWFRAAITTRAAALGLGVRFVTSAVRGGWDPASNYRRFESQAERLQR